jgi:hypothetical protein
MIYLPEEAVDWRAQLRRWMARHQGCDPTGAGFVRCSGGATRPDRKGTLVTCI